MYLSLCMYVSVSVCVVGGVVCVLYRYDMYVSVSVCLCVVGEHGVYVCVCVACIR